MAPCWWTDPLFPQLWEFSSLSGKDPQLLLPSSEHTHFSLATRCRWVNCMKPEVAFNREFPVWQMSQRKVGVKGKAELNNTCPLGRVSRHLYSTLWAGVGNGGWQLGHGARIGGLALEAWQLLPRTTAPGFLRCLGTRGMVRDHFLYPHTTSHWRHTFTL